MPKRHHNKLDNPPTSNDRLLTTLLITDIIDSTQRVVHLGDRRWLALLEAHDQVVRAHVSKRGGRTIKHMGDGLIALFTSASDAIDCAQAAAQALSRLSLEIRCGIHVGEVSVRGNDVFGIAVHTAARVAAASGPGEVLVSPIVRKLTNGAGPRFRDAGSYRFKGLGQWRLYRVTSGGARPKKPRQGSHSKEKRLNERRPVNRRIEGRAKGGEDE